MRILASIILLLLVLRGVRAGEGPAFNDTCNYAWREGGRFGRREVMCGNQCIGSGDYCYCGDDIFQLPNDVGSPYPTGEHCCLEPGETCNKELHGPCKDLFVQCLDKTRCSEGRKVSMSSACNTTMGPRCYNSYQHSQYIGRQSHYTCPDACVPWEEMCRGVSWCEGDHQVCGPDLRCPPQRCSLVLCLQSHNIKKLSFSSSLVPGHHYCIKDIDTKTNDGQFDSIDRSDEKRLIAAQSPRDLNISSFTPCEHGEYDDPGVMCGTDCRGSGGWCRDDMTDTCYTGSGYIRTNNPILCRDPRVWANVSCSSNFWNDGTVEYYGLRCTGQNMRCVVPWYTLYDGDPADSDYVTQCPDKSDQVFNSSLTCSQHLQQQIDFHTQSFCNENYGVQSFLICTNKSQWLSGKDKSFTDPHSCQSSFSIPGPDCLACTNSSYFPCQSGQCVHPDLVCDGHPQCTEGEDEELSMCKNKFLKIKIIQPLATFRCQSLFYQNMFIFATPRNNKSECWNDEDEIVTGDNSTIFLVISANIIVVVYIGLKYSGLAKKMLIADNQNIEFCVKNNQNFQNYQDCLDFKTLKNYGNNHDQSEAIEKTNIHILNSIHTQIVDNNKATCELFYKLEQEIHERNESEVHFCLHKKMDPKVVENILDSCEPVNIVKRILIMELKDKITKSPIIKEVLGTTFGVIKVVSIYIDLFKDTALSIVILQAVGSLGSVWELHTNFSSVIVITMFSSILIPLLLSTLNLVVNRRKFIEEHNFSRKRKYLTITLCWVASFLNPIILDAYFNELKEDVRKLTENHDIRAMSILRKCRNIKKQIVKFHKTELGNKTFFFVFDCP